MEGKLSEVLTNLLVAEFSSIDDGITEVSKRTGIDSRRFLSFIRGEAVPEKFEAAKLVKSLSVLKDDTKASFGFLQLCDQHLAEFSASATIEESKEMTQTQELKVEQMEAPVVESATTDDMNKELEELRRQVEEYKAALEAKEREIKERQEQEQLLANLDRRASDGVQQGWLPPVVYKELFDDLNQAKFSATCQEKQIDPYVEMYAIHYFLELMEKFGKSNTALFSSTEPEPIEEASDEKKIEQQAYLNFKLYKANGNLENLFEKEE